MRLSSPSPDVACGSENAPLLFSRWSSSVGPVGHSLAALRGAQKVGELGFYHELAYGSWLHPHQHGGPQLRGTLQGRFRSRRPSRRPLKRGASTSAARPYHTTCALQTGLSFGTCLVHMVRALSEAIFMLVVMFMSTERAWKQCMHGTA